MGVPRGGDGISAPAGDNAPVAVDLDDGVCIRDGAALLGEESTVVKVRDAVEAVTGSPVVVEGTDGGAILEHIDDGLPLHGGVIVLAEHDG